MRMTVSLRLAASIGLMMIAGAYSVKSSQKSVSRQAAVDFSSLVAFDASKRGDDMGFDVEPSLEPSAVPLQPSASPEVSNETLEPSSSPDFEVIEPLGDFLRPSTKPDNEITPRTEITPRDAIVPSSVPVLTAAMEDERKRFPQTSVTGGISPTRTPSTLKPTASRTAVPLGGDSMSSVFGSFDTVSNDETVDAESVDETPEVAEDVLPESSQLPGTASSVLGSASFTSETPVETFTPKALAPETSVPKPSAQKGSTTTTPVPGVVDIQEQMNFLGEFREPDTSEEPFPETSQENDDTAESSVGTVESALTPFDNDDGGLAPRDEEELVPSDDEDVTATDEDDDGGSCFSASATVQLQDGSRKAMHQVSVGDSVLVAPGHFSEVFMFTHKLNNSESSFVSITTSAGLSLSVTPGHYIYINGALAAAKATKIGDTVELGTGGKTIVTSVSRVVSSGLYNPQTVHGDIIVDGVRASTYTTYIEPQCAHALLTPLRAAYVRFGASSPLLNGGATGLMLKLGA